MGKHNLFNLCSRYSILDPFDSSLFLTPFIVCASVFANGFPQGVTQVSFDARLDNGRRDKIWSVMWRCILVCHYKVSSLWSSKETTISFLLLKDIYPLKLNTYPITIHFPGLTNTQVQFKQHFWSAQSSSKSLYPSMLLMRNRTKKRFLASH